MSPVYPVHIMPAEWQGNYPHLSKLDRAVWTRFLQAHAQDFSGFAYDVALGGQIIEGLGLDEPTLLGWQYNTACKVDVVAYKDEEIWIIEVKPEAYVSAFGAALAYTMLAEREQFLNQRLVPTIVCQQAHPDVAWCCRQLGINVVTV